VPLHRLHEDRRGDRPGSGEERILSDREPLSKAIDDYDVTLAMTPGQLVLVAIGLFVIVRFIRGLRRG
jgi:hypothetical protein